ncbi:hypothetical protein NQ176_g3541 [Zarea fungicola]|uniref:Uncharacterized protein n=1 Tax=Zarea fungicola TaxID=93591 RepID=A0ACC1NJ34_9HYPO|nr:hypothetical protein NQ176_g3541 [Lecanicillium fungicola]
MTRWDFVIPVPAEARADVAALNAHLAGRVSKYSTKYTLFDKASRGAWIAWRFEGALSSEEDEKGMPPMDYVIMQAGMAEQGFQPYKTAMGFLHWKKKNQPDQTTGEAFQFKTSSG